jgi:opacity protein-like surface antigen
MADSLARAARWLASCAAAWALAAPAGAQVIYGDLRIGMEWGNADTSGANAFTADPATGDDWDTSPIGGAAFGFQVALHELAPPDWSLPESYLRTELEWLGGRNLGFKTGSVQLGTGLPLASKLFSTVKGWALLQNVWMDFPLYGPMGRLLGRRMRVFEPLAVTVGGGIGGAWVRGTVTDNTQSGSETTQNFAWQVGAGPSYDLTELVTLSLHYRYLDLGKVSPGLFSGAFDGPFSLDLTSHDVIAGVRWDFYRLPFSLRTRW